MQYAPAFGQQREFCFDCPGVGVKPRTNARQVLLWVFDTVLAIVPVESPVLRLARLVRLIRLVKLVRAVQGFDSLIIMTTALKDGMRHKSYWRPADNDLAMGQ